MELNPLWKAWLQDPRWWLRHYRRSVLVFFGRCFAYLYIRLHIMRFWSRFCQLIWERDRTPVKGFTGLPALVNYIRLLKWKADDWRKLWDATSCPDHVQWLADNDPGKFIGDCDDFAVYEAEVVDRQFRGDFYRVGPIAAAYMLTVMWYRYGGKVWEGNPLGFGGHNVCLILVEVPISMENPTGKLWCYMDYGWPSTLRKSIEEVAADVRHAYASDESMSVGWAVSDTKVKPKRVSWK